MDASQERDARRQENTIPVGEATRDLGLDISPERLLAAVPETRANPRGESRLGVAPHRAGRLGMKWAAALALGVSLVFGAADINNRVAEYVAERNMTIPYGQFTRALQQGHVASVRIHGNSIEGRLDTDTPFIVRTSPDPVSRDRVVRLLRRSRVDILQP